MQSISLIEFAWELKKSQVHPDQIAARAGKDRATIYRWFSGIRLKGIRKFVRDYEKAKTGRRQPRKTDPVTKARIYAIREKYHQCCGEKIKYWMKKDHDVTIPVSTIYRILGQKYQLRSKWKKNQPRGPVPHASRSREVIQNDTVDFGELFAFTAIDIFGRDASVIMKDSLTSEAGAEALDEQMEYFEFADLMQRDGGPEFKDQWGKKAVQYCHRIRTARPYKKNEQAFIEVFNRTLRKECLGWMKYKRRDLAAAQVKVNEFLDFYNNRRPHLSLNLQSPKEYLSHLR